MEYPNLPMTSVAEFRMAAHQHYEIPHIVRPPYISAIGMRGFIGALFVVIGAVSVETLFSAQEWKQDTVMGLFGLLIFGGGGIALIASKVRSRKRVRKLNTYLVEQSRHVDELYESGGIPLKPAQWEGEVPPTLSKLATRGL